MPDRSGKSRAGLESLSELVREHPVITAVLATLAIGGAVLGGLYLPPEWSVLRRLAAGALSGAGIGFFIVATRLIG